MPETNEREALARVLLGLKAIQFNHNPPIPADFSDPDPDNWSIGSGASYSLAFPPRGPMVDAVIDAILASDWLKAHTAAAVEAERAACEAVASAEARDERALAVANSGADLTYARHANGNKVAERIADAIAARGAKP